MILPKQANTFLENRKTKKKKKLVQDCNAFVEDIVGERERKEKEGE